MLARGRTALILTLSLATALALTGFAAALAASRPASPTVTATDFPPQVRRTLVWYGIPQAAPHFLHIESTSTNASQPDDFQISYQNGNFTLVYQRAANGPVTTQYTLTLNGLVEWNDTSGEGNFQDGTIVAYTPLGPGAFGRYPITHTESTTADGVHVNTFGMVSNKGDVALNLTIADGFVSVKSGEWLTPMEAKLSFLMSHTMSLPNTQFSLQLGISTDQSLTLWNQSWDDLNEFSTDDHSVNITSRDVSNPSSAFFAWSNTATVNGVEERVIPTELNETAPGDYNLLLTYPRPATGSPQITIVHDPTIGVVSEAYYHPQQPSPLPFQAEPLVYGISLVAIAALVAATAFFVNRRRKVP